MSTVCPTPPSLPWHPYPSHFDLALLYSAAALLLRSETPIDQLLVALIQNTPNRRLQKTLQTVHKDVTQGRTLGTALARHPRAFPQMSAEVVDTRFYNGTLSTWFNELSDQYEQRAGRQDEQQLLLPIGVFFLSSFIFIMLVMHFVPLRLP